LCGTEKDDELIQIDTIGRIASGDDEGHYVKVKELFDEPSSFLVLVSATPDFTGPGGDYWVEDLASLQQFFEESHWVVEWQTG
jgi:hypothetical protein